MMDPAIIETFAAAFTEESLEASRNAIALSLVTSAETAVEINLKRVGDRETSAIRVTTYAERLDMLRTIRAALALMREEILEPDSPFPDFSWSAVDP